MTSIDAMAEALANFKEVEKAATIARIQAEKALIQALGQQEEGSKTHTGDAWKVTITGKVTRKMDWTAWENVKEQIPEDLRPVKTKLELDETGVKWLRDNRADLYMLLPVTVTPAKTAVEIKMKAVD